MHAWITKHFAATLNCSNSANRLKNSTKKVAQSHLLLANEREPMAIISAATATAIVARAAIARPSQALGLPQLRVRAEKVRCGYSKDGKEAAAPAVVNGASLLAAASAMTVSAAPALSLVDERMSTEGTGLSLGLSNNLLGWILLGVFGLIWSLYTVYTSSLDEDEDSDGLSL